MNHSNQDSPSSIDKNNFREGKELTCKNLVLNKHRAHSDPLPFKDSPLVDDTDKDFVIFEDFDIEESETFQIYTNPKHDRENKNQSDILQHNLRYKSENKEVCVYLTEVFSEPCTEPPFSHQVNAKCLSESLEKAEAQLENFPYGPGSFRDSKSCVLIESPPLAKSKINMEILELNTLQKKEFEIYCDTPEEQTLQVRKLTQGTSDTRVPFTPLPCIRRSENLYTRDDFALTNKLTPILQDSIELHFEGGILSNEDILNSSPINSINLLGNAGSRFVNAIYMEKTLRSPYVNNRYHKRDQIRVKLSFQSLDGFGSSELFSLSNITSLTYSSDSSPGNDISGVIRLNELGSSSSCISNSELFKTEFHSLQLRRATKRVRIAPFRSLRILNSDPNSINLTFHSNWTLFPKIRLMSLNSNFPTFESFKDSPEFPIRSKNKIVEEKLFVMSKGSETNTLKLNAEIGYLQDNLLQEKTGHKIPILLTIQNIEFEESFPEYTHDICFILGVQHSHLRSSKENVNEKFFSQITRKLSKNDRITVLYMDDEEFLIKMCECSNEVKALIKNLISVKHLKSSSAFSIFDAIKKVVKVLKQRRYHSNFTSICIITDFSMQTNMTNQEVHANIKDLLFHIQEAGLLEDQTFSVYGIGYGNKDFNILCELCYVNKGEFYHTTDHPKYITSLRLLTQRLFSQRLFEGELLINNCLEYDITLRAPGHLVKETKNKRQWKLPVNKLLKGEKKNFIVLVEVGQNQTDSDLIDRNFLEVQFKAKRYQTSVTIQNRRSNIIDDSTSNLYIELPSCRENIDLKESYRIHLHYLRLLLAEIIEEFTFSYLRDDFELLKSALRPHSNLCRLLDFLQNNVLKLDPYEGLCLSFMEHVINTIIQINRSQGYSSAYSNYLSIMSHTILYEVPSIYSSFFQQTTGMESEH